MCCPRSPPAGFISIKCILWKREKPSCSLCVARMTWRAWIFSSFQKQKRLFLTRWPISSGKVSLANLCLRLSSIVLAALWLQVNHYRKCALGLLLNLQGLLLVCSFFFFFFCLFLNNNKEGYRKFHMIILTPVLDLRLVASARFWCAGNVFFKLFIFGCAVSSPLWALFSSCGEQGLLFLLQCTGFSLQRLLLLRSSGSRFIGFSSGGSQA